MQFLGESILGMLRKWDIRMELKRGKTMREFTRLYSNGIRLKCILFNQIVYLCNENKVV